LRLNCLEADRRLSDTRDRPTAIGSLACSRSLSPNKGVAAMRLIELSDISKTYRLGQVEVPVLRGISMAVEPGEFVALMGASGSGKSTLMHLLGFLDRPTSGRYWFEGREVSSLSADERAWLRNRKIGFVFQNFNLLPRTSALENVLMPLSYSSERLSDREARTRAQGLLERVGLAGRSHHEPSQLSGGEQQRVAIARALVNRPLLLLADEPTGNLDSRTSEDVLRMFRQLNDEDRITIVLVTHDPAVARHAHRVVRILDGRVVDGNAPAQAGGRGPERHREGSGVEMET